MTLDQDYEQYKQVEQRIRLAIEEGLTEAKAANRTVQTNYATERVMDVLEKMFKPTL